jgi:hypothetical protein
MPTNVSDAPQILDLEKLISATLSTYLGRGIERSQDHADVVKLVQANDLPRNFGVDPKVQEQYLNIWDGLHRTRKPPSN